MSNIRRVVASSRPVLGLCLLLFLTPLQVVGAGPAPAGGQEDALPSRQTTSAQVEQDRLVYADDFSDPNSGWRTSDDADAAFAYTEGEYQILVRESSHFASTSVSVALEDYLVETDLRCERGECGSYGLVFGLNDDGSEFYALTINDQGEYAVWKYIGDQLSPLIDWRSSPALQPGRASNHIAVSREGADITASANDETLIHLSDSTYTGPRTTGVFVLNTNTNGDSVDVRFDNFRLYTLSETTDYAKHKIVSASSSASRFEVGSAVDDNAETQWVSGSEDEFQSITVNIGAKYTVDQVFVDWAATATQWGLAAWNGSTWETVAATVAGFNGVRILEFAPREAQFWTLLLWTHPESESNYAVREWELRGPPGQNPNLALAKSALASASAEDSSAGNAVDGNADTQWIAGQAQRQWLLIDFDQALPLDRITINWAESYAQQYGVLVGLSDQWQWVGGTTEGQGDIETFDFERTAAEWVLLYAWQPATSGGYAVSEISVWDTLGGGRLDVGEPIPPIIGTFGRPIETHQLLEVPLARVRREIQDGMPSILPSAPDLPALRRLQPLPAAGGK